MLLSFKAILLVFTKLMLKYLLYLGCVNPAGLGKKLLNFRLSWGQWLDIEFTSQPSVRAATQLVVHLFPLELSARKAVVERKTDKSAEEGEGHFPMFFVVCCVAVGVGYP